MLATHIPTKFKIVGENPVGQSVAITAKLLTGRRLAFFHCGKIFTNVFGFDMAERHFAFGEDEIRSAAKNSRGFVRGNDSLTNRFQKFFERWAVRMFGGVAVREIFFYFVKIRGECGHQAECAREICERQFCAARRCTPARVRLQAAAGAPAGFKGRRQNEAPLSKTVGDDVRRLISKSGRRESGNKSQRKSSTSKPLPLMMLLRVPMGMGLLPC